MIRAEVLKYLLGAREGKRGEGKENVRRGATAKGAMEKSWYVRVIEMKNVRREDPINYFLPTAVRSFS